MNSKNLERYAEIKSGIKMLEEEAKMLKAEIEDQMMMEGVDKEDTEYGTFSLASRVYYKYSPKVKELEEKVNLRKHTEEEKGIAEGKEVNYLVFKEKKDGK